MRLRGHYAAEREMVGHWSKSPLFCLGHHITMIDHFNHALSKTPSSAKQIARIQWWEKMNSHPGHIIL